MHTLLRCGRAFSQGVTTPSRVECGVGQPSFNGRAAPVGSDQTLTYQVEVSVHPSNVTLTDTMDALSTRVYLLEPDAHPHALPAVTRDPLAQNLVCVQPCH